MEFHEATSREAFIYYISAVERSAVWVKWSGMRDMWSMNSNVDQLVQIFGPSFVQILSVVQIHHKTFHIKFHIQMAYQDYFIMWKLNSQFNSQWSEDTGNIH